MATGRAKFVFFSLSARRMHALHCCAKSILAAFCDLPGYFLHIPQFCCNPFYVREVLYGVLAVIFKKRTKKG